MIYVALGALSLLVLVLVSWVYYLHSRLIDNELKAESNEGLIVSAGHGLDALFGYIRDIDGGLQYLWDNFDEISELEEKTGKKYVIINSTFVVKTKRGVKEYNLPEFKRYLEANRKRKATKAKRLKKVS